LLYAADAITKGFKYTFGENFKRGNCSFHVIKDIDKYLSIIGSKPVKRGGPTKAEAAKRKLEAELRKKNNSENTD
jgi:hypothetical protein